MKTILIDIAPDGKTTITTNGFVGKACQDATRQLEKAFGSVVKDTPTSEMHARQAVAAKHSA